ncbi:unnamed protein product [Durusdinium trenchii]|uniref:EF-hand domain-containing protein n=1 Tax=Durusdinium trenchii TaxID=1381693 RepID=A0ABP0HGK3_9DINO
MPSYKNISKDEEDDLEDAYFSDEDTGPGCVETNFPSLAWLQGSRDGFTVGQTTAAQVASWTTFYSAICMYVNRHNLAEIGLAPSTFLCNLLFIVGSDLGSTMSGIFYGVIGSFYGLFTNWLFLGFFPGAYHGENHAIFWAALSVIILYTFIFLFVKVNETIRFWALITFTGGYAMKLIDPASNGEAGSGKFQFNFKGYAENGFVQYLFGALLAVIIFLVPPRLSLDESYKRVDRVSRDVTILLKRLMTYYCRNIKTLEIYDIREDFQSLQRRLDEASALGASSWYESLGKSKRRAMTLKLTGVVKELMDYVEPLLEVVVDEDFQESHTVMMQQVGTPMTNVVEGTLEIVEELIRGAEDGSFNEEESDRVQAEIDDMPNLVTKLQRSVQEATDAVGRMEGQKAGERIQPQTLGEHYVALTVCRMAQVVMDNAKQVIDSQGLPAGDWSEDMKNSWGVLFDYEKGDLKWAARSTVCLLVNFLVGWHGYCDWQAIDEFKEGTLAQEPVCLIQPYSAGLASINVILLSRYSAGTIKNAMDRVANVVLASVVGTLGYSVLGWCSDVYRVLTLFAVFLATFIFMYMKYDGSGDTAGIAQRLAAIAVSSLMSNCSNDPSTAGTYSSKFHDLSDIIFGVLIMTIFDFIFGESSASEQAITGMTDMVEEYQQVFKEFFDQDGKNQMTHEELKKKVASVSSKISECASTGSKASMEPRFWRMSFNSTLYDKIISTYKVLCNALVKTSRVIDDDKDVLFDRLAHSDEVKRQIMYRVLDDTTRMVLATIKRDRASIPSPFWYQEQQLSDNVLTEKIVSDLNAQPHLKTNDRPEEMPLNPSSRCCAMTVMIQSMVNVLWSAGR